LAHSLKESENDQVYKNGYLSKTMKCINIGVKSSNDWIGEELAQPEVPADFKF
jgi:hypothetical protein